MIDPINRILVNGEIETPKHVLPDESFPMWLKASCHLDFDIAVTTPFLLMLRPRSGWNQWVARESYIITPNISAVEFTDMFGNLCQRVVAQAGPFSVHTSVDVETAESFDVAPDAQFVEVQNLPLEVLPFLYPSRYCESDRFTKMAAEIVAGHTAGYKQCHAIVNYIRKAVRYTPGSGQKIVSASEVNVIGQGVCRDLAHLGIACCRALSIPSRMVVGYLENLQPMDLHAWFEAFVGNRWYVFDPTQETEQGGRIAIGFGRDAADVALYTQFGTPVTLNGINVEIHRMPNLPFNDPPLESVH